MRHDWDLTADPELSMAVIAAKQWQMISCVFEGD